jgi:hypothetical protein
MLLSRARVGGGTGNTHDTAGLIETICWVVNSQLAVHDEN